MIKIILIFNIILLMEKSILTNILEYKRDIYDIKLEGKKYKDTIKNQECQLLNEYKNFDNFNDKNNENGKNKIELYYSEGNILLKNFLDNISIKLDYNFKKLSEKIFNKNDNYYVNLIKFEEDYSKKQIKYIEDLNKFKSYLLIDLKEKIKPKNFETLNKFNLDQKKTLIKIDRKNLFDEKKKKNIIKKFDSGFEDTLKEKLKNIVSIDNDIKENGKTNSIFKSSEFLFSTKNLYFK